MHPEIELPPLPDQSQLTTLDAYEKVIVALAMYREARGEDREARRAVYHVIANRKASGRFPRVMSEVVLQPMQFSSFNANDPNATVMPRWNNPVWWECCSIVDDPGEDPTGGCLHYHSVPDGKPFPKWAWGHVPDVVIGPFKCYRNIR